MSGFQKIVVKYKALSKCNWTVAAYVELTDENVRKLQAFGRDLRNKGRVLA